MFDERGNLLSADKSINASHFAALLLMGIKGFPKRFVYSTITKQITPIFLYLLPHLILFC